MKSNNQEQVASYRSYHQLQNYIRMSARMHSGILRTLFAVQILIVSILFFATMSAPYTGVPLKIDTYMACLPFTFLIYLLHPFVVINFRRRSQKDFGERTRRGPELATEDELKEQLPTPAPLPLSDTIALSEALALQHLLVTGSSGSGKTVLISKSIAALKSTGIKGVCHGGKDGEMVARFFNPKTDYIFNPLDNRSININLFDLISDESDFDSIAASVVPAMATREKFFSNAARDLLSGILRYAFSSGTHSNHAVWSYLNLPRKELYKLLLSVNSPGSVYIEADTPQSQSCLSTLRQHTRVFKFLANPDKQIWFPLREWVADDNRAGMIFLSTRVKQREALSPLMSLFIDRLANEILSQRDHPDKIRMVFWIDEWGVLPAMPAVKMLLQQGRSKGSVMICGIQEKAQLDGIYGPEVANSLINQFSTYAVFRMNNSDSAEYFSRLIGERETEQTRSSFSSGTRDQRETESYHQQQRNNRLVLPAELQSLPNLNCFLKIHGFPITKTELTYTAYPDKAPAFIQDLAYLLKRDDKHSAAKQPSRQVKAPSEDTLAIEPDKKKNQFTIDDFEF